VTVYKQFYKWFGGRHQACYSMFIEAVQQHNNCKIGLVRASETRMGGYLICWLRIMRLRAPLEEVVVQAKFKNLPAAQRPLIGL
jgi:hypothetical protein